MRKDVPYFHFVPSVKIWTDYIKEFINSVKDLFDKIEVPNDTKKTYIIQKKFSNQIID